MTGSSPPLRPVLSAWISAGLSPTGEDEPGIDDFTDSYKGRWPSFDDFAHDLAEDTGMLRSVPEHLQSYFNWDTWVRDLGLGCTVVDAGAGEVYVFENH